MYTSSIVAPVIAVVLVLLFSIGACILAAIYGRWEHFKYQKQHPDVAFSLTSGFNLHQIILILSVICMQLSTSSALVEALKLLYRHHEATDLIQQGFLFASVYTVLGIATVILIVLSAKIAVRIFKILAKEMSSSDAYYFELLLIIGFTIAVIPVISEIAHSITPMSPIPTVL